MDTREILENAELGIVELAWLSVAIQAFLPPDSDRPLISVETVFFVPWDEMKAALDAWEKMDNYPAHLDVINKIRAAAESLKGE